MSYNNKNLFYGKHIKLKIINNDIELYIKIQRYKDILSNMRHGLEYMVSYIVKEKTPENLYDDLYLKIEALKNKGIIDRSQANVFHGIRKLANTSGSHLEEMAGEEILISYPPYMREVERFLEYYGDNNIEKNMFKNLTVYGERLNSSNNDIDDNNINCYTPSFLYTSCRMGLQKAKEEYGGKEIKISGAVGNIFGNRFNIESISEGKNVFVAVDSLDNCTFEKGSQVTIIGIWTPPSAASLGFGNSGTIKETRK